ncbi:MAG: hypothetical protein AAGA56_27055, partial [Myxococcota bacterium]
MIPRVSARELDTQALLTRLRSATPLVITDLFRDAPIAALDTLERARSRLGSLELRFRPEYTTHLLARLVQGPPPRGMPSAIETSIDRYFFHVDEEPSTTMMCTEEKTPAELLALAPIPPLCEPASDDTRSTLFLGNAGNHA